MLNAIKNFFALLRQTNPDTYYSVDRDGSLRLDMKAYLTSGKFDFHLKELKKLKKAIRMRKRVVS